MRFSLLLLHAFFFLLQTFTSAASSRDEEDVQDELQCTSEPLEVTMTTPRLDERLARYNVDPNIWNPYSTFDNLCRVGGDGEPGLRCFCMRAGTINQVECNLHPLWTFWQTHLSFLLCIEHCTCVPPPTAGAGSSRDSAAVAGRSKWLPQNQRGSSDRRQKSGWPLRIWKKTKRFCGIQECHSNLDCAGMSCGRTICGAVPMAPGAYEHSGACLLVSQPSIFEASSLSSLSSLGGRSVEGDGACACNSTYVSNQCCWADDGLVWEDADAKMGQLLDI